MTTPTLPAPRPAGPARPAAATPPKLCPAHTRIWRMWRDNHYDPANPREPGGGPLLDSRTPHGVRQARWEALNRQQMDATEELCRSGVSPQCNWPVPS